MEASAIAPPENSLKVLVRAFEWSSAEKRAIMQVCRLWHEAVVTLHGSPRQEALRIGLFKPWEVSLASLGDDNALLKRRELGRSGAIIGLLEDNSIVVWEPSGEARHLREKEEGRVMPLGNLPITGLIGTRDGHLIARSPSGKISCMDQMGTSVWCHQSVIKNGPFLCLTMKNGRELFVSTPRRGQIGLFDLESGSELAASSIDTNLFTAGVRYTPFARAGGAGLLVTPGDNALPPLVMHYAMEEAQVAASTGPLSRGLIGDNWSVCSIADRDYVAHCTNQLEIDLYGHATSTGSVFRKNYGRQIVSWAAQSISSHLFVACAVKKRDGGGQEIDLLSLAPEVEGKGVLQVARTQRISPSSQVQQLLFIKSRFSDAPPLLLGLLGEGGAPRTLVTWNYLHKDNPETEICSLPPIGKWHVQLLDEEQEAFNLIVYVEGEGTLHTIDWPESDECCEADEEDQIAPLEESSEPAKPEGVKEAIKGEWKLSDAARNFRFLRNKVGLPGDRSATAPNLNLPKMRHHGTANKKDG